MRNNSTIVIIEIADYHLFELLLYHHSHVKAIIIMVFWCSPIGLEPIFTLLYHWITVSIWCLWNDLNVRTCWLKVNYSTSWVTKAQIVVARNGFEPLKPLRRQIYSLIPLPLGNLAIGRTRRIWTSILRFWRPLFYRWTIALLEPLTGIAPVLEDYKSTVLLLNYRGKIFGGAKGHRTPISSVTGSCYNRFNYGSIICSWYHQRDLNP